MIGFGSPEFKVGAFVVIVSSIIGAMSLKVSNGTKFFSTNDEYWFEVENASGLVSGSSAKMAGISVGRIHKISLVNGRARIFLNIDSDVPLTDLSIIQIRSDGILGDKHVEIKIGESNGGKYDPGKGLKVLESSDRIGDVVSKMSRLADTFSRVADKFAEAVGTSGQGDPTSPLGRIILNLEKFTSILTSLAVNNEEKFQSVLLRVDSISQSLDEFLDSSNPEGFRAGWVKISDSIEDLSQSVENVREITGRINRGEGTLGRLVNDDETVDSINYALENVNRFLGGVGETQTTFDYHAEYVGRTSTLKSYISLKLRPGLDRYYQISLVADQEGVVTQKTVERDTDGTPAVITEKTTFKDKVKISAIMGKTFYDFTLRGGLMESSGGVGLDYHLFNKDLKLSLEAFNFEDTNLKAFVRYNILKGVYVKTGGDRLNSSDRASFFIGGGIFITNEDLKVFASQLGSFAN